MWALAAIEPVAPLSSVPTLAEERDHCINSFEAEGNGLQDPMQTSPFSGTHELVTHRQGQASPPVEQSCVHQLQAQVEQLQTRLNEALASKDALEQQLQGERQLSEQVSPRPANGTLTEQDWDRLHLRMLKAERALEQERYHVEIMRHQLDSQRAAAAIGETAAVTIHQLEADLSACRSLASQRTNEAEALQRALRLSDETVARLRAQLSGLLEANQAAVTKEQELEQKVQELRSQLEHQSAETSETLAAARHMAQHGTPELHAIRDEVARLRQEKEQLRHRLMEQDAALATVRADCARKDAGIRALEKVLSNHGRHLPMPTPATAPATVTIDMAGVGEASALGSTPTEGDEQVLAGGLTESQWKLIMLSEEVRSLRSTVQQLRRQAAASPPGLPLALPTSPSQDGGTAVVVLSPGSSVGGAGLGGDEEAVEVMEVDLPPEEIRVRVAKLAQQMIQLEEELQGYMQRMAPQPGGDAAGVQGGGGVGMDGVQQQGGVSVMGVERMVMTPTAAVRTDGMGFAAGAGQGQGRQGGEGEGGKGRRQGHQKRSRRRGWWGWLMGSQEEGATMV